MTSVLEDFVIARNTEAGSTLPSLLRIPLGDGIILKAKDSWPRTGKIYCHRVEEWPVDAEVVERVAVRSCVRRGAAIDLVLDRGRENRSQIVVTNARGRQMIFWQTARTAKQARPAVSVPGARASGVADLEIAVDVRERYPFAFADRQASTRRESLHAGDYGLVVDGLLQATVERKSLADLVMASPSARSGSRQFRSSSARLASSLRSGPTASSQPPGSDWPRRSSAPTPCAASKRHRRSRPLRLHRPTYDAGQRRTTWSSPAAAALQRR